MKPSDIKFVAVSHYAWGPYRQCRDVSASDAARAEGRVRLARREQPPRFKPEHPVTKLEGDKDVFGDGSVTILATPGHTPGHQSLLVKLPKTGALRAVRRRRAFPGQLGQPQGPRQQRDQEQTKASMERIAGISWPRKRRRSGSTMTRRSATP